MNQKRQYKIYTKAFKEEAVALVIDQDFTVPCDQQVILHYISMFYNSYRCTHIWTTRVQISLSGT
jgi:hypothetical protein